MTKNTIGTLLHIQFDQSRRDYTKLVLGLTAPSIRRTLPTGENKKGLYVELDPKLDVGTALKLLDTGLQGNETGITEVEGKLYRVVEKKELEREYGGQCVLLTPPKDDEDAQSDTIKK